MQYAQDMPMATVSNKHPHPIMWTPRRIML